jgi:hypothetical protein
MKKSTRLLLTLLILLLLGGVSYINSLTPSRPVSRPFLQIKKEIVDKVFLTLASGEINIYKKNNIWFLTKNGAEFKADQARVNALIDSFIAVKKDEVVSGNKNKHQDLGIGKEKVAFHIKNNKYTLYIGKNYRLTKKYIRINDENEVYAADGFDTVSYPEDYRDLSVYLVGDENKTNRITLSYDYTTILFEKKAGEWLVNGKSADKKKVDMFINDLKTLSASDIHKEDVLKNASFVPLITMTLKENGRDVKAEFYFKDGEKYYLKMNNANLVHEISGSEVESLKMKEEDFIKS